MQIDIPAAYRPSPEQLKARLERFGIPAWADDPQQNHSAAYSLEADHTNEPIANVTWREGWLYETVRKPHGLNEHAWILVTMGSSPQASDAPVVKRDYRAAINYLAGRRLSLTAWLAGLAAPRKATPRLSFEIGSDWEVRDAR